jgi:hypothetical protein
VPDLMAPLVPPPPQYIDAPGVIRWAVGSPDGPRSQSWSVVGHGNTDDVYVGLRSHMGETKLSLHPAKWRLALTEQAAAHHGLPSEVDRVVTRWTQPPEVASGWRHGATIVVPTSHLGPGYPEPRVKRGGSVAWFPAPPAGQGLRFDVMLGAAGREDLTVLDCVGEVGRINLRSGAGVWVVATQFEVDPEREAGLATLRTRIRSEIPPDGEWRGWAWGDNDEDGGPLLLDISTIDSAPQTQP